MCKHVRKISKNEIKYKDEVVKKSQKIKRKRRIRDMGKILMKESKRKREQRMEGDLRGEEEEEGIIYEESNVLIC